MYTRCLHAVFVCLLLPLAGTAAAQPDGPDIRVGYGTVVATAADYEMDGTMWVAIACLDSGNYIYRSTDHGLTWSCLQGFNAGFGVDRLELVVGEGDSNFIHVFVNYPQQGGNLYDLRFNRDGSSAGMFSVAYGPDTIRDFAVCRDYTGSNYWLYAVVTNPESQSATRLFRSADYGVQWQELGTLGIPLRDPHLSAGAGSYSYLAGWYGDTFFRAVNTLYLDYGKWMYWTESMQDEIQDPVIGAAFTKPESAATIWCLWSQNYQNSGDWDVKYCYSTNGGNTWTLPEYLAGSTQADEGYPDLRNYTSLGNQYINVSYISDDNVYRTVYRRYAQATTPDHWSDTLRINQGSAGTGSEIRPKLCCTPGGPFSGAGCVFVGAGLNGCWWNGPYPSAVAEPVVLDAARQVRSIQPSIGRGPFLIWTTTPALVCINDHAGRLIRTLALDLDCTTTWDGTDERGRLLADGVYFCRFTAGDYHATEKVVLQK